MRCLLVLVISSLSSLRGERSSQSIKADSLISNTSNMRREDASPDHYREDTSLSPGQARSKRDSTVTQEEMDQDRAQVLLLEARQPGGGGNKWKKKHLDVGPILDCSGSSLLDTSSCSKPRSPETKKPKLSQVLVAPFIVLDEYYDMGSFQAASSPGSKQEKIGKRNEEVKSEPEKNREVFDEDALDFEPEEEDEDVASVPVEDAAEVSITVAELLEASENKEDVTGDMSGDAVKDITGQVCISDTNTIKEVARCEASIGAEVADIVREGMTEDEAIARQEVTKDEAITADEKAATEAAIKAAEESNKDLVSFR